MFSNTFAKMGKYTNSYVLGAILQSLYHVAGRRTTRSFAAKVAEASGKDAEKCQVCNSPVSHALYVKSIFSDQTNAWKFKEGHIQICNCNQQEVYG